ncbi:hypothetical protein M408DRAFT_215660 [Serendipita vermifera MAFF 305830]|uniref:Uncharacterized protein n=1 Tax=Serendipita vermifera MAFF 305830 TaxID=933852 RepID=A0A0C3B5W9_SERVB|nr:hypothetical protein M408DRAFT_215660 [Serendipita vermifera MAFF 305830]
MLLSVTSIVAWMVKRTTSTGMIVKVRFPIVGLVGVIHYLERSRRTVSAPIPAARMSNWSANVGGLLFFDERPSELVDDETANKPFPSTTLRFRAAGASTTPFSLFAFLLGAVVDDLILDLLHICRPVFWWW